ncbi:MAG: hypothetical protein RLZZ308_749 [Candidatus Parcubacteria bacterium]|jgi:hypothetical protein
MSEGNERPIRVLLLGGDDGEVAEALARVLQEKQHPNPKVVVVGSCDIHNNNDVRPPVTRLVTVLSQRIKLP